MGLVARLSTLLKRHKPKKGRPSRLPTAFFEAQKRKLSLNDNSCSATCSAFLSCFPCLGFSGWSSCAVGRITGKTDLDWQQRYGSTDYIPNRFNDTRASSQNYPPE